MENFDVYFKEEGDYGIMTMKSTKALETYKTFSDDEKSLFENDNSGGKAFIYPVDSYGSLVKFVEGLKLTYFSF